MNRSAAESFLDPRRWQILAVLAVAQFMVVLDATIVNVALPAIQTDLGFDATSLQWVVNGYTLLFGGFLLLGGRLADLLGRRRRVPHRPRPLRASPRWRAASPRRRTS